MSFFVTALLQEDVITKSSVDSGSLIGAEAEGGSKSTTKEKAIMLLDESSASVSVSLSCSGSALSAQVADEMNITVTPMSTNQAAGEMYNIFSLKRRPHVILQ